MIFSQAWRLTCFTFLAFLGSGIFLESRCHALSVEEAYRSIPHRRTVFEGYNSKLNKQQIDSLNKLFGLTEEAIVIRMESLNALFAMNATEQSRLLERYRTVTSRVNELKVPPELEPVKNLILQAINLHQNYFSEKYKSRKPYSPNEINSHKDLRLASLRLHQSFETLIRLYPNETPHNKDAFFDYLCALDFF